MVRVVGRFLRQFDGAFCSDERTGVRCPEAIADPDGPVYMASLSVAAYYGKRGSHHSLGGFAAASWQWKRKYWQVPSDCSPGMGAGFRRLLAGSTFGEP